MTLKLMFAGIFILMLILGWTVVIAVEKVEKKTYDEPESPHTEDFTSVYEDTPEVLAGSEMPKEMVDAIEDKPKKSRGRKPKKV